MQIVDNKALVLRTRFPDRYTVIPKSAVVGENAGVYEVAVRWGLDEVRVLKNLGVKNVPSPINARYDWPGRYKPMAHQKETAAFLTLHRRAFVFSEPGTGKTLSALWAADYLMKLKRVRRCLIICPVSIMHSAWMSDLQNSIIHRSAIVAHHQQAMRRVEMVQGEYEFVIINYDGLDLIAPEIVKDGRFDLVIVDECFVAGTLVATPLGRRPIEQLRPGDKVLTSDGVMSIKRIVRNSAKQLVEVKLGNGNTIRCTPEHPFFTDAGWVCAKNLAGRRLISGIELSCLRAGIPLSHIPNALVLGEGPSDWLNLFKILRTEEVALDESRQERLEELVASATRTTLRTEDSGTSSEAIGSGYSCGEQAVGSRGERHGDDADGEVDFRGFACGVGMELPCSVGGEAARLSYELQTRLLMAALKDRSGSGWGQSHSKGASGAGQEKGGQTGAAWVEGVTYIECTDETPVYNFEVEGTPNYFVGDHWLVHNCSHYKNVSTKRWKALHRILDANTLLWMMTGTPASQSPLDAYGLAKLVNPNGVPKFFTAWRDATMVKVSMFKWNPRIDAQEKVHEVLQPAIRFTKAQCLDLPPVITETREVPLTAQQKKYYNMLKTQMLVRAAGETISAVNAATEVNKLLQISAGAAYTDNAEVVEFDCSTRLNVLLEVLEETERKVLVFAPFRHSIDTIATFLTHHAISNAIIHGEVSPAKRTQIFSRFQNESDPRVLVIQPQAAAHGVTLTAADTVAFWGPVMSTETYIQCCARSDRKGQTSDKVTVIHIQGSDIERKMFKRLAERVEDNNMLVKLYEEVLDTK